MKQCQYHKTWLIVGIFVFRQSDVLQHTPTEQLNHILVALVHVHYTAGPHLHMNMNTRQHTRMLHMPSRITHCVQNKSEFSQTGNDVSSCLQGDGGSC